MKQSGVYKIQNTINGKSYIGSSFDIVDRWNRHKRLLSDEKHHNTHLQNAWHKYGSGQFTFEVLELVPCNELLVVEQKYLNDCKLNPDCYYNTVYEAGAPMRGRVPWNKGKVGVQAAWNKGILFSDDAKRKMSEAAKNRTGNKNSMFGKKHSEETRKKLKIARRSRPPVSIETREKMRQSHLARWRNQ